MASVVRAGLTIRLTWTGKGNPGMYEIRAGDPALAGHYVLVLDDRAYDFVVDG